MCVQRCSATSWGRIRHTGRFFALSSWPTVMTPSRHRRLVLAYDDSNPSSDGSVLASATPPARHHHCPPIPLRPRPHPRWQGFTRAQAQVQQQPVQQQQLVQQRVITLAHAMGGRHVLQDGSLWTRPIGRPPLPPGSKKAQRGAVQSVEAPSDQKERRCCKCSKCCPTGCADSASSL